MKLYNATLKRASIAAHIGLFILSLLAPALTVLLSLSLQINSSAIAISHLYKYWTAVEKHVENPSLNKDIQSVLSEPEVAQPLLNALIFVLMATLPFAILGAVSSVPALSVVILIALTFVSLKLSAAIIDQLVTRGFSRVIDTKNIKANLATAKCVAAKLSAIDLEVVEKANISPPKKPELKAFFTAKIS